MKYIDTIDLANKLYGPGPSVAAWLESLKSRDLEQVWNLTDNGVMLVKLLIAATPAYIACPQLPYVCYSMVGDALVYSAKLYSDAAKLLNTWQTTDREFTSRQTEIPQSKLVEAMMQDQQARAEYHDMLKNAASLEVPERCNKAETFVAKLHHRYIAAIYYLGLLTSVSVRTVDNLRSILEIYRLLMSHYTFMGDDHSRHLANVLRANHRYSDLFMAN